MGEAEGATILDEEAEERTTPTGIEQPTTTLAFAE